MMNDASGRRGFIRTVTIGGAGLALASKLPGVEAAGKKKSVLVFTKSSGFEHQVVKEIDGKPSIAEKAVRGLGEKYNFDVNATKDGGVFDSKEFPDYSAVFFFTTGDLTTEGTDKHPPMTEAGKQRLLDTIKAGWVTSGRTRRAIRFIRSRTRKIWRTVTSRMGNRAIR